MSCLRVPLSQVSARGCLWRTGTPSATSCLCLAPFGLHGGDCSAGLIGLLVVHPEARGKGIGSALINDVHQLARSLGLGLLVLAGDPAF
ncbi:MAG: hypothetical protein CME19_13290 [Gemmatimonadetes bacterium]|nr:hypothetical protein [Gemmatimonadota bacterium]